MSTVALLFALSASTSPAADPATLAAIEATCHDYVDGQREADPQRVARSLHPDLAKRAVLGDTPDERLGLRRMSKEELVALTKQGVSNGLGHFDFALAAIVFGIFQTVADPGLADQNDAASPVNKAPL